VAAWPGSPTGQASDPPAPWVRLVDGPGSGASPHVVRPPSVRRVMARFAVGNVLVAILLLAASVWASHEVARKESLTDARVRTDLLATLLIEPNLDDTLLSGDPRAVARLDTVVERQLRDASVIRLKIWDDDQRIVYSDEPRLLARSFPTDEAAQPPPHVVAAAQFSEPIGPENVYERSHGQLLEVYRRITTPSGNELLLELYFPYDMVTDLQRTIWADFAPISATALLLIVLLQAPLAHRMIRSVRAGDRERLHLYARAADASTRERRRIAGNLHDGVVQDLSAAPLIMARATERLARGSGLEADDHTLAAELSDATVAVRGSVASLRSLLIELYPPHLARSGLPAALADLAARIQARGVQVRLDLPDDLDLPPETAALLFRVAQEALQNVVKHACAQTAVLTIEQGAGTASMSIGDDGTGFAPASISAATGKGHFGMRVLCDLAEAADASLDLATAPGRGTTLRIVVRT
jgi:two-component system NarL family sensor kinase